ncbi:class I SAM-dependent methyltransferase [Chloroflexota bacterium]
MINKPNKVKPKKTPFIQPGVVPSCESVTGYAEDRANRVVDYLEKYTEIKGKNVLDIGSGNGDLILPVYQRNGTCYALEPDTGSLVFSRSRLGYLRTNINLIMGQGETLPFNHTVFDIVFCHQVLEHTERPDVVIQEAVRVLKPGGYLYLTCPNYLFPYEFHYKVPWIPYFPKRLAKIYLKMLGKSPSFLNDHIFYINTFNIEKMISESGLEVQANTYAEIVTNIYLKPKRRQIVNFLLGLLIFLHLPNHVAGALSPNVTIVAKKKVT